MGRLHPEKADAADLTRPRPRLGAWEEVSRCCSAPCASGNPAGISAGALAARQAGVGIDAQHKLRKMAGHAVDSSQTAGGLEPAHVIVLGDYPLDKSRFGTLDLVDGASYLQQTIGTAFPAKVPNGARFLVVFDAYFDDSGTHAGSQVVTIGGYVSAPFCWLLFESEWQDALDDFGIDFFRMSQFANRAGVFQGWTEGQRRARLPRLIEIINRNAIMSVGVGIDRKLFDSVISEKAKAFVGGAYGLAFSCIAIEISKEISKVHPEAQVAYVLESGTAGAGEILKVFQENLKDPVYAKELRILSLRFEDKRRYLPLQAADILAYELYKHLPKQPTSPSNARYPLRELSSIPRRWFTPDEDSLRTFSAVLEIKASL